jgi:hypothetical protein
VRDWVLWHQQYDDPQSALRVRLALVQAHLAAALDAAPPGPVSLLSLCAGQGHDVAGVLPAHPRRGDVTALLVEADPRNAAAARRQIAAAGLGESVQVREADASRPAAYAMRCRRTSCCSAAFSGTSVTPTSVARPRLRPFLAGREPP